MKKWSVPLCSHCAGHLCTPSCTPPPGSIHLAACWEGKGREKEEGEGEGMEGGREKGGKISDTPCKCLTKKLNGEANRKLEIEPAPLNFCPPIVILFL